MTTYTINGTGALAGSVLSNTPGSGGEQDAIEFYVTSTAWATAIRFYRPTTSISGTVQGRIWVVSTATTGSALAGTDVTFTLSGTGWQTATLSAPVQLTANQRYRVGILWGTGRFASTSSAYWTSGPGASGVTNGPLVVPAAANGTGGKTAWGVDAAAWTYPNVTLDYNYSCDVTVSDVNPNVAAALDVPGAYRTVSTPGRAVADVLAANGTPGNTRGAITQGVLGVGGHGGGTAKSYTAPTPDTLGVGGHGGGAAKSYINSTAGTTAIDSGDIAAADPTGPGVRAFGTVDQAVIAPAVAALDPSAAATRADATVDQPVIERVVPTGAPGALRSGGGPDHAGRDIPLDPPTGVEASAAADRAPRVDIVTALGPATARAGGDQPRVWLPVTPNVETDTAKPLRPTGSYPLVEATAETDTAFVLPLPPTASELITAAVDTQIADVLRPTASHPVTQATAETDTAFVLRPTGSYPTAPAAEVDWALPLVDTVSTTAWDDAIEAADRVPIYTLRADWGRDGTFSHPLSDLTDVLDTVTVTRELAGELPAEVGLIEGYSAATMSFTISGQWPELGVDPVQEFAPYRTDAMLYAQPTIGVPVELETGFQTQQGRQTSRRFTGSTSSINPSSAARDVQINCLDAANKLRAPITQAPVGLDASLLAKYGDAAYFARYNSQWLIDRILRANGIYASPPTQDDVFLSVTMHGSQVPEVGGGGVPEQYAFGSPNTTQAWVNDSHPFGMLYPNPLAPAPTGNWYADERLTMGANSGFGWSGWVLMPDSAANVLLWGIVLNADQATSSDNYQVSFEIVSGIPAMYVYTPTEGAQGIGPVSTYSPPEQPTWMFIGCHWGFVTGGVNMTMNVNGRVYPANTTIPVTVGASVSWQPTTTVLYELDVPATNLSWWKEPFPPDAWTGQSWISQADIDPGLNELTGIPELVGEDSWSLLTEVVDAEYGVAAFSTEGRFAFQSRAVIRPRGTPERVTAQRELADMVTTTDEAGVRNSISAALTPLLVGPYEWIIASDDVDLFQSGPGTSYFDVTLPAGVVIADSPFRSDFFTTDGWNQLVDTYPFTQYMCVSMTQFHSQTTLADDTNVDISIFRKDAATITIAVYNRTTDTVVFKTPDVVTDNGDGTTSTAVGVPAFKLPGRKLAEQGSAPQVISDPGSIDLYGPRTYELGGSGGSRWHQHPEATAGIAEALLGATGHPVPVLDAVTVPHDPRRNLGDPITVADPYGLGEVTGTIAGITTTYADGSATEDQLTVRPLAPPGFGLWDDPVLGLLGHTLRFGP